MPLTSRAVSPKVWPDGQTMHTLGLTHAVAKEDIHRFVLSHRRGHIDTRTTSCSSGPCLRRVDASRSRRAGAGGPAASVTAFLHARAASREATAVFGALTGLTA